MMECIHPASSTDEKSILLKTGYQAWAITVEHPDRDVLDEYLGTTHAKRTQWRLHSHHSTFPSSLHVGSVISYGGHNYRLLSIGNSSLRVQALSEETYMDSPGRPLDETGAFQRTAARDERIQRRRDARQRLIHKESTRRRIDDPRFTSQGLRICYELTLCALPPTLRDDLPEWARGGSSEVPTGESETPTPLTRVGYVQLFALDETDRFSLWETGSEVLPGYCRVALETREIADAPVLGITNEEAEQLVRQVELVEQPARTTFVGPASILPHELRQMIAPSIVFPCSSELPAEMRRVSLEARGQQVRVPRTFAHTRIDTLALSPTTHARLQQAEIVTLGELLELEETQLQEILSPESLYELSELLTTSTALEGGKGVRIPKEIVQTRIDALGLSSTTFTCLQQAKITTLGLFLSLEEEQLRALLSPESLYEMQMVLFAKQALPVIDYVLPHNLENTFNQGHPLTDIPQIEDALFKGKQVMCEFADLSIQDIHLTHVRGALRLAQVRERQGVLQVARDGKWITAKRFWIQLTRSQQQEQEKRQRTPHASFVSGLLPMDARTSTEERTPLFEEVYFQLTETTYDDANLGTLHLAYVSTLVDRLDGRQSGPVQVVWLSEAQLRQSMLWDQSMKRLETLDLRIQVNAYARAQGADHTVRLLPEAKTLIRKRVQQHSEDAYNRVPVRDPRYDDDCPLELPVRREDLEGRDEDDPPIETLRNIIGLYINYPEKMPEDEMVPRDVLQRLSFWLQEDQKQTRELNRQWGYWFADQPHPSTTMFIRERVYRTVIVRGEKDRKTGKRSWEQKKELTGYRFIIGLLSSIAPPGFVLEPRGDGPPRLSAPEPITAKRIPNYVVDTRKKAVA